MKIYTSYFAKEKQLIGLGVLPIAISLFPPKWFNGQRIGYLAPKKYMLDDTLTEEQYEEMYIKDVLEKVDIKTLGLTLRDISHGKDVAFLCFEKSGDFCHRHILAKWLTSKTGVDIQEYEFPEKQDVKKEIAKTPTLFDNE